MVRPASLASACSTSRSSPLAFPSTPSTPTAQPRSPLHARHIYPHFRNLSSIAFSLSLPACPRSSRELRSRRRTTPRRPRPPRRSSRRTTVSAESSFLSLIRHSTFSHVVRKSVISLSNPEARVLGWPRVRVEASSTTTLTSRVRSIPSQRLMSAGYRSATDSSLSLLFL